MTSLLVDIHLVRRKSCLDGELYGLGIVPRGRRLRAFKQLLHMKPDCILLYASVMGMEKLVEHPIRYKRSPIHPIQK